MEIKVNTSISNKMIIQKTSLESSAVDSSLLGNMRDIISIQTADTQEKGVIQALISLGWTPPDKGGQLMFDETERLRRGIHCVLEHWSDRAGWEIRESLKELVDES